MSNGSDESPTPTVDGAEAGKTEPGKDVDHNEKSADYPPTDLMEKPKQIAGANDATRGLRTGQSPMTQAPAVGLFGGVAPSGADAEEGRQPVRSLGEEEKQGAEREKKSPDPWSVRFDPGESANPKVRPTPPAFKASS